MLLQFFMKMKIFVSNFQKVNFRQHLLPKFCLRMHWTAKKKLFWLTNAFFLQLFINSLKFGILRVLEELFNKNVDFCSNPTTKSILGNVQAKTSSKFYFNPRTPITLIMGKNGFKKCSSNVQGWWGTSVQGWALIKRPMMEGRIWWINVKTFFPHCCTKKVWHKKW